MKGMLMYDCQIQAVTPKIMRQRGADAFDRGLGFGDHGMNPWAPAIEDWQDGWRRRQAEGLAKQVELCSDQLLIMALGMTS